MTSLDTSTCLLKWPRRPDEPPGGRGTARKLQPPTAMELHAPARIDAMACDGLSMTVPQGTLGVLPAGQAFSSPSSLAASAPGETPSPLRSAHFERALAAARSAAPPTAAEKHIAGQPARTHATAALALAALCAETEAHLAAIRAQRRSTRRLPW